MGFYGNITNTSRTQFEFDRIYPNREAMDRSCDEGDGIYPGRYVLVNYESDSNVSWDYYVQAYKVSGSNGPLFGISFNQAGALIRFKYSDSASADNDTLTLDQIICVPGDQLHNRISPQSKTEFWKVNGADGQYATFEQFENEYAVNYQTDIARYGTSRGYDSTVWQKVVQNGVDKYVMIAELNTIVPTFDVEADAPTMVPLTPHFDTSSTNVYYKLHWSPTWGFRVKAANSALRGPVLDDSGNNLSSQTAMSTDPNNYLSDERIRWYKTTYDGERTTNDYVFSITSADGSSGTWVNKSLESTTLGVPAAIYYNKDGFDPKVVSYGYQKVDLTADTYKKGIYYKRINDKGEYILATDPAFIPTGVTYYKKIEDHILVQPTGNSGHTYNDHNGTNINPIVQPDTQELSIMLPAIGNTIAAVWDIMYGDEVINGSPKRNLDIDWERGRVGMNRHGLRLISDFEDNRYQYNPDQVNTVAGAINSVHDLLGMIIDPMTSEELDGNIDALDENRIYYNIDNHIFYRKRKKYEFTKVADTVYNTPTVINITADDYEPGLFYKQVNGEYVIANDTNFDANTTYYTKSLKAHDQYSLVTTPFDEFRGELYTYKDYAGSDVTLVAPTQADYVRDSQYYPDKVYYNWKDLRVTQYPNLSDVYEPNKFYYRNTQGDYVKDPSETPVHGRTYYEYHSGNVKPLSSFFSANQAYGIYVPNKYFYKDGDDFKLATGRTVNDNTVNGQVVQVYYALDTSQGDAIIQNEIYTQRITFVQQNNLTSENYAPGLYYVRKTGEGVDQTTITDESAFELCMTPTMTTGVIYYRKEQTLERITQNYYKIDRNTEYLLVQFHENEFYHKEANNDFTVIPVTEDIRGLIANDIYVLRKEKNTYHGDYCLRDQETVTVDGQNITYNDFTDSTVSAFTRYTSFYETGLYHYLANQEFLPVEEGYLTNESYVPGIYYTKQNNDYVLATGSFVAGTQYYMTYSDYVLDTYPRKTHGTNYYIIAAPNQSHPLEPVTKHFFEPYKYYEKNNNDEFVLITRTTNLPENIYEYVSYYVEDDANHIYQPGAKWNLHTKYVPASVTLATRTEDYELEPFADFARNINTMHGMLLKIKAMLDYDHMDTRDPRTVQGALNLLKDKINQLSEISSGQLLIGDSYGRVHGAEIVEDNWIGIDVNDNPVNPKITINHKVNGTIAQPTIADREYLLPTIDAAGHVTGFSVEDLEVGETPGYKTINGDSGSIEAAAAGASMSIVSGDSWIGTAASTESGVQKVTIAHQNPDSTNTTAIGDSTAQTPTFGASFAVPYFTFDGKGHISSASAHNVTLPSADSVNIADRVLTNYTTTSVSSESFRNINSGDTLTSALNMLESKINNAVLTTGANMLLTNYVPSTIEQSNLRAITASDSLGTAVNMLENKVTYATTYQHPIETTQEVEVTTEDPFEYRNEFWNLFRRWQNDNPYNVQSYLEFGAESDPELEVYEITEDIPTRIAVEPLTNCYTLNERSLLVPVTPNLNTNNYQSDVTYYRIYTAMLADDDSFFDIFNQTYNTNYTKAELLNVYELGSNPDNWNFGTHTETQTVTTYEPYTLGDITEKTLALEDNVYTKDDYLIIEDSIIIPAQGYITKTYTLSDLQISDTSAYIPITNIFWTAAGIDGYNDVRIWQNEQLYPAIEILASGIKFYFYNPSLSEATHAYKVVFMKIH